MIATIRAMNGGQAGFVVISEEGMGSTTKVMYGDKQIFGISSLAIDIKAGAMVSAVAKIEALNVLCAVPDEHFKFELDERTVKVLKSIPDIGLKTIIAQLEGLMEERGMEHDE